MDHAAAQEWLDRYIAAWLSYDPEAIAGLFTEDVVYRYHPTGDPVVGREAVVAAWLGDPDSADASTRDEPGTRDLMKQLRVVGPPTFVMLAGGSRAEIAAARVTGAVTVDEFLSRLARVKTP